MLIELSFETETNELVLGSMAHSLTTERLHFGMQ